MEEPGNATAPLFADIGDTKQLEQFLLRSQGMKRQRVRPSERIRGIVYGIVFVVFTIIILLLPTPWGARVSLKVGDVSPVDIRAPRHLSYISEVLTRQERERAAASVQDYYLPPDPRILRQQLDQAHNVLDYINTVRKDPYATVQEKKAYLKALASVSLSDKAVKAILSMSDPRWQETEKETISVLSRAMSREIRENQLAEARRSVPTLVSAYLTDDQALVVEEIVRQLLRPNALYDKARTEAAREAAREAVKPFEVTYERGQTIVRAGDVVTEAEMEALEKFGLVAERFSWRKAIAVALLVVTLAVFVGLGLYTKDSYWLDPAQPRLLTLTFLAFVVVAKFMIPQHALLPYFYPLAVLSMVVATTMGLRLSMFATVAFGALAGYLAGNSFVLAAAITLGSAAAPVVLGRAERLNRFVWAGVAMSAISLAFFLAFTELGLTPGMTGTLQVGFALILNGVFATGLTVIVFYLMGGWLDITTPLQLIELSRPTSPLLRQLLLKAPGTYHHSLIVANMAERAAEAVGADSFLVRVGAYYHDVGKLSTPHFFVENQAEGMNPHARLDPHTSAQIIINHVKEGLKLADRYHLPRDVKDFIPQHHGTMLVRYFYVKAVEEAGDASKVDESEFRYPGPKPQKKETAILMLADGVEAAVRASAPHTQEEIDRVIRHIFAERLLDGQLDESNLTLRDLNAIRMAFMEVLKGLYHPRVKYPELKAASGKERGDEEPVGEEKREPVTEGVPAGR